MAADNLEIIRNIRLFRPWKDTEGNSWVTAEDGKGKLSHEGPALFTKEQWMMFDGIVVKAAWVECPFAEKLIQLGLTFDGEKALARMAEPVELEGELIDLDEGEEPLLDEEGNPMFVDPPVFQLTGLPLPLVYESVHIEKGEILVAELKTAAHGVGKRLEETFILGSQHSPGGFLHMEMIHGLAHAKRLQRPSIEKAVECLRGKSYYGPYLIVHGGRQKHAATCAVKEVEGIQDSVETPMLPSDALFVVQATLDVIRVVLTRPPTLIQWGTDTVREMRVVACVVPQIRLNFDGDVAIVEIKE